MDASKIKEKIYRFRILIIGRANAGKTTILKRVCNTQDSPEIYNRYGRKIDIAVLTASRERGEHDIENEMVFRSNPGFIFHDSRGFEAGGESEYDKVNAFIADRSKKGNIKDRIHTIWYCIPMDEESRCFTEGELKFFSHCDTGSIPVIVLFTKFDALYDIEFARLTENGVSRKDAKKLAPKHAEETSANGPQLKLLYHSKDIRHPPKCHICLPDMDKDDADCGSLIERTAGTLDNEVLKELFVSTQQTNLELCMKYAVEVTLAKLVASNEKISPQDAIARLGSWFPHIKAMISVGLLLLWIARIRSIILFRVLLARSSSVRNLSVSGNGIGIGIDRLRRVQREEMGSRLLSVAPGSSPLETIVQLSSATVIIFDHSFYIFDKRRYLEDRKKSVPSCLDALEQYIASPQAADVREAVSTAVQAYQEAASTASSSTRKVKQNERMAELMKAILQITLRYRLPRP